MVYVKSAPEWRNWRTHRTHFGISTFIGPKKL